MIAQQPPAPAEQPIAAVPPRRSFRISIPAIVVALALLGSIGFIAYVVLRVEDNQIPLLVSGFAVLGVSLVVIAIWSLVAMWRAASRTRGGRALGLAIVGGIAGLAAIACFTVAALLSLVWTT